MAVITPVLNGGRFLGAAMRSVQMQTYPHVVHVVVDNASDDDTSDVIAEIAGSQPRIPVIRYRNPAVIPMVENWNRAVSLVPADATFVAVLCADDEIAPEFVASAVSVGQANPGVSLIGTMRIEGNTVIPTSLSSERQTFDGKEVVASLFRFEANEIPHTFGVFRITDEDRRRPFFDSAVWAFDTDACMRYLVSGDLGFVHEPLFRYRLHAAQATHTLLAGTESDVFDRLLLLERWGPQVLDPHEFDTLRRRQLRVLHRHLLAAITLRRHGLVTRYRQELLARDAVPSFPDYIRSVAEWPIRVARR